MTVGINGWFVGVGRVVVGGVGRLAGRGVLVRDDVVVEGLEGRVERRQHVVCECRGRLHLGLALHRVGDDGWYEV